MITKARILHFAKHRDPILSKLRHGFLHVAIHKPMEEQVNAEPQAWFFQWIDGDPHEIDESAFRSQVVFDGTGRPRHLVVTATFTPLPCGEWEMAHSVDHGLRSEGVLLRVSETDLGFKIEEIVDIIWHDEPKSSRQ